LDHCFKPLPVEPALRRQRAVDKIECGNMRVDAAIQTLRHARQHSREPRRAGRDHDCG
jgi:hypothetical protein